MKLKIVVVLLVLLLLCIMAVFYIQNRTVETFDNIKVDIGNELSYYFYHLGLCILQKKDFEYNNLVTNKNSTMQEHFFFNALPTYIKYEFDTIHDCFIKNGLSNENIHEKMGLIFDGLTAFELFNNDRYLFWNCMKPLVHKILDDGFQKSGLTKDIENPIIHFRCADTPFLRYSGYHLQYYSFFKEALENIAKKTKKQINKVDLMSCVSHKANETEKQSCSTYANSLQEYLNNNGYQTEIVCNSNIDDFAAMFYAPAVISTWSSFSFISGFFGNGIYISTEGDKGKLCSMCEDVTLYGYNLPHELVTDYNNTDDVVKLLYQS